MPRTILFCCRIGIVQLRRLFAQATIIWIESRVVANRLELFVPNAGIYYSLPPGRLAALHLGAHEAEALARRVHRGG
jgi:hypothetical protein